MTQRESIFEECNSSGLLDFIVCVNRRSVVLRWVDGSSDGDDEDERWMQWCTEQSCAGLV